MHASLVGILWPEYGQCITRSNMMFHINQCFTCLLTYW